MSSIRFPAEWEKHRRTWIAWPHNKEDWPGNFEPIDSVYKEIVKALVDAGENLQVLSESETGRGGARPLRGTVQYHSVSTDRSWLRDSVGTCVFVDNKPTWIIWGFNAWAKYDNYHLDKLVSKKVAEISGIPFIEAKRPDNGEELVLEGGAIETNGKGVLLTTEECLLSDVQARNPGLSKSDYEKAFKKYLGINKTLWLPLGFEDDDTHGHIDDVCRFVNENTVLLSFDEREGTENNKRSIENLKYLETTNLDVIKLPAPDPIHFEDELLPASYANFYIANRAVLLPVFNDKKDKEAIEILKKFFSKVTPIYSRDLVLGCGALHCLTQQEVC